jgi:8-oxo-dGTP pyrophosphatase MutT (NUDIX family)
VPQSLRPELTVAAVVKQHDRFLMIEEMVRDRAVFNQPAGHVEPGESLIEAVVRETREESAWDFVPDAITGIYLYTDKATARTYLRVVFTGQLLSHHAEQALDDGILRTLWLGRPDLLARRARLRSPLVLRSIDDFLAGHRLPVDMAIEDGLAERAARL